MQKRHLSVNISEARALFKDEHPEESVGKPKFASLHPAHVLLSSQMPRNVRACQHHQNIIIIFEALHKFDCRFPLYSYELPLCLVCNEANDICWNNMCVKCKGAVEFREINVLD